MSDIKQVTGTAIPLVLDDIDTDRILPARFLRCVTFDGLEEHAFEDDRAQDAAHPFNDRRYAGANILLAGRNFGCGSSREHAPQSLARWGIAAILAESFSEIFFGNCISLGIPCATSGRSDLERMAARVEATPEVRATVDLQTGEARFGEETFEITMPASARNALMTGQYDFLAQLHERAAQVRTTAESVPYFAEFHNVPGA